MHNIFFKRSIIVILLVLILIFLAYTFLSKKLVRNHILDNKTYNIILDPKLSWVNTYRSLYKKDLKDRIILLGFWRMSCIVRSDFVDSINYLKDKFGNDLSIIGVHSSKFDNERNISNVEDAILRYGIDYPVILDKDSHILYNFGIKSCPGFVLLDTEGKVISNFFGKESNYNIKQLEKNIGDLIRKNSNIINQALFPVELGIKNISSSDVLRYPTKIEFGKFEDKAVLFISDTGNNRVVVSDFNGEVVSTIGSGKKGNNNGSFMDASFNGLRGLSYGNNSLFIADTNNNLIRRVDLKKNVVSNRFGDLIKKSDYNDEEIIFNSPWDIHLYSSNDYLLISTAFHHQIVKYDFEFSDLELIAGNVYGSLLDGYSQFSLLFQTSDIDYYKGRVYFVDSETSSLRYLKRNIVKTLIGKGHFHYGMKDGNKLEAMLQYPLGLDVTREGIYIADSYNHAIRFFDFKNKELSTLIGNGTRGSNLNQLNEPSDVLKIGNFLYIVDTNNHKIKKFNLIDHSTTELNLKYKQ